MLSSHGIRSCQPTAMATLKKPHNRHNDFSDGWMQEARRRKQQSTHHSEWAIRGTKPSHQPSAISSCRCRRNREATLLHDDRPTHHCA